MNHPGLTGFLTGSGILTSIGLSGLPAWIAVVTAFASIFGLAALRSTAFLWRGERDAEKAKADRISGDLAAALEAHRITLHKLEVSEKKPDVDKLYDLMKAHDERSATIANGISATLAETTKALAEVASVLQANTSALQLWATDRAQRFPDPD